MLPESEINPQEKSMHYETTIIVLLVNIVNPSTFWIFRYHHNKLTWMTAAIYDCFA